MFHTHQIQLPWGRVESVCHIHLIQLLVHGRRVESMCHTHVIQRYTHKTSGFKTSGFKTSGFKTSETSGLQNVRFTKRQVYNMSGLQNVRSSKRPVAEKTSIHILYLWLVEIRRFCCSHVCRQSYGSVLFSILDGCFAIYHHNK
jgi:hypothetical protein